MDKVPVDVSASETTSKTDSDIDTGGGGGTVPVGEDDEDGGRRGLVLVTRCPRSSTQSSIWYTTKHDPFTL